MSEFTILQLAIVASTNSSKPRKKIDFELNSNPESTVYLLGVDHSVNILKTGNNIDDKSVFDDMRAYNIYKTYGELKIEGAPAGDLRYKDVGAVNAFIITNAYGGYVYCYNERAGTDLVANADDNIDLEETIDEDFESIVRVEFPETWIFEKIELNNKGFGMLKKDIPDTITSWDITGFTMSKAVGLGIAKPQKLIVAQNFFLMVHLPYSIRIGEILRVEVTVFNYLKTSKQPLDVDVTLYSEIEPEETQEIGPNSDETYIENTEREFDFYTAKKQLKRCDYIISQASNTAGRKTNRIKVLKGAGISTYFYIKATKAGDIKIKVRAQVAKSKRTFDEVHKTMKVEYDGEVVDENLSYLVDLRDKRFDSYDAAITLPHNAISSSIKIEASVIGDLIGPALLDTEELM